MKEAARLRGVEEGILLGTLQGSQEGKPEGIEAVAANMLLRNRSVEEVAETTGLTVDEVIALKKKTQARANIV